MLITLFRGLSYAFGRCCVIKDSIGSRAYQKPLRLFTLLADSGAVAQPLGGRLATELRPLISTALQCGGWFATVSG